MEIFEVLVRRTPSDPLVQVGSILAPDVDMARLLARETHVRHGEAAECFVAHRGDVHRVAPPASMTGLVDRTYRTQEGYVGVGARMRRLAEQLAADGRRIEGARPGDRSTVDG